MERSSRKEMLLHMLEREPNDLFLNYALGVEYAAETRIPEAETQFKKVLAIDNGYVAAYYQLGKLLETLPNPTQALAYYKTGLEKARLKKDNKAIGEFDEAIFMLEE